MLFACDDNGPASAGGRYVSSGGRRHGLLRDQPATAWERREHVTAEFGKINLPFRFFDAIDGTRLNDEALSNVDREARKKRVMPPLDNSALACLLSHMAVFRELIRSGDDMAAVFEDDCLLSPDIHDVLASLEAGSADFDAVMLHERGGRRDPVKRFRPVRQVTPGHVMGRVRFHDFGAYGYVITRRGAEHMLREFPRPVHEIDWILPRFWENGMLNVYYLNPPVVFHNKQPAVHIETARRGSRAEMRRTLRVRSDLFAWRLTLSGMRSVRRWLAWRKLRRFDRLANAGSP